MSQKEKPEAKILDVQVLKKLSRFLKPYKFLFGWILFLTIAQGFITPIRPYLIQKMIDGPIANLDSAGLKDYALLMLGLITIQALMQFAHSFSSDFLGQNIVRDIRQELFKHILTFKLQYFDHTPIGRLVTRNISDVETLSKVFTQGVANIGGDSLQVVFLLAMMLYTDWRLTLITLVTFPFLIISTYIFKEKVKEAYNELRTAVSNLNTFLQEHITGMSIVQIFTAEQREMKKFDEINKEFRRANIKTVLYYSIYFPVAEIIGAASTGLLVWYGASAVLEDELSLGVLIAFIMYINQFFRPVRMIADHFNTLQLGIVSADRILKLLDDQEFIQHKGTLKPFPIRGDVQFENVRFAYEEPNEVLRDISFKVNTGQTFALVGATGAGKSSVINLLSKFYEIKSGTISIDGISIEEWDLGYLRSSIGVVLQDVFLFSDSIFQNITLGDPEITEEQVIIAAKKVGAWEFIQKLPGGLSYNVMERGATLSVGQRQLISFVRAMVYDPKILILDEATSSVDSETESLIQKATEKMMQGRTSIIIAHRLSTIRQADQILVLDKGEIVEKGSHDELLSLNGLYSNLYKMQYRNA